MVSAASAPSTSPGALATVSWTCPDCRRALVASGGCAFCPACGFSPCG